MTRDETMDHIRNRTPFDQLRSIFSTRAAAIEQAGQQRIPMDPIDMRAAEFKAVQEILDKAIELGLVRKTTE